MFQVNNKATRATWMALLACLFWLLWTSPRCLYLWLWAGVFLTEFQLQELMWKKEKFQVHSSHASQPKILFDWPSYLKSSLFESRFWHGERLQFATVGSFLIKCSLDVLSLSFEFLRILYFFTQFSKLIKSPRFSLIFKYWKTWTVYKKNWMQKFVNFL